MIKCFWWELFHDPAEFNHEKVKNKNSWTKCTEDASNLAHGKFMHFIEDIIVQSNNFIATLNCLSYYKSLHINQQIYSYIDMYMKSKGKLKYK